MNETYWRTATDPGGLLHALLADTLLLPCGLPTRRRVRLIGVAAADRTSFRLPRAARHLFRFAEQFADDEPNRLAVEQIAGRRLDLDLPHWATLLLSELVDTLDELNYFPRLNRILGMASAELGGDRPAQADIVRDVIGNPFVRPPAFPSRWRTAAVVGLARGAYEGRRWDRLPLLADALEEAGCDDTELLEHCRTPGPHVRGCWAVDRVLGRR